MIARGWIQDAKIVLIFCFFILGILTYCTYNDELPIANVVKNTNGGTLMTRGTARPAACAESSAPLI